MGEVVDRYWTFRFRFRAFSRLKETGRPFLAGCSLCVHLYCLYGSKVTAVYSTLSLEEKHPNYLCITCSLSTCRKTWDFTYRTHADQHNRQTHTHSHRGASITQKHPAETTLVITFIRYLWTEKNTLGHVTCEIQHWPRRVFLFHGTGIERCFMKVGAQWRTVCFSPEGCKNKSMW